MTNVSLPDAYAKACQLLGEQVVMAALTTDTVAGLLAEKDAEIDRLIQERDDLLHRADHAPE